MYAVQMERNFNTGRQARIPRSAAIRAARGVGQLCVCFVLALAISSCGSSGKSASTATHAIARTSSTQAPVSAPMPRLLILSPRQGAHTGPTLTVRVAVSDAPKGGAQRFRYVLDRRLTRFGSSRLTFHDLAPGRHHLRVLMTNSAAHASITFIVRAPVQVAAQALPPEVQSTTSTSTPASPVTATPPPAKEAPPAPKPAPPPASTPSPQGGGIPQGPNAGDGDSDNHGAPSDGDGNF